MRAEIQAKVDYLKELFAIDERKAHLMVKGQAFYNPVTRRVAEKYILCNNCAWKAQRIRSGLKPRRTDPAMNPAMMTEYAIT